MELIDMISELEEYYECAGFEDFYERILKKMSEEEIRSYYAETFEADEESRAYHDAIFGEED